MRFLLFHTLFYFFMFCFFLTKGRPPQENLFDAMVDPLWWNDIDPRAAIIREVALAGHLICGCSCFFVIDYDLLYLLHGLWTTLSSILYS